MDHGSANSATDSTIKVTRGLDAWAKRFEDSELPALSYTVKKLQDLSSDDEASVGKLAQLILNDPTLTSSVLRVANSVHYNLSRTRITTISRAIVTIGMEAVRCLCISMEVIDALLGKSPNERLLSCVASAFHSAMQAKFLAKNCQPNAREEVFIAALLYRIGETAFWSLGNDTGTLLDAKMRIPGADFDAVCKEVLGFTFDQLSKRLVMTWQLGDLLQEALTHKDSQSPMVKAVVIGNSLTDIINQHGWESDYFKALIEDVSKSSGAEAEQVNESFEQVNELSRSLVSSFSNNELQRYILAPGQEPLGTGLAKEYREFEQEDLSKNTDYSEGDSLVQLSALKELSSMPNQNMGINTVFNLVMEGLFKGVGFDRVVLAMINSKENNIAAKSVLGQASDEWAQRFVFTLSEENIFSYCLGSRESLWMGPKESRSLKYLRGIELNALIGEGDFLIGPILINKRKIGVFFADRGVSERAIQENQFSAFKLFCEQANQSLRAMATKT